MRGRIIVLVAGAAFLAACADADWDHARSAVGLGPSQVADQSAPAGPADPADPPASAVAPQRGDDWCRKFANDVASLAAEEGFDEATQQARARTQYDQCMTGSQGAVRL
ncbi:MAG: hypothetical protein KGJ78_11210 [Alphaproteobacteria bacterium]|nr:hypothetical protein [Alphaproteobacteria bacterium]